MPISLETDTPLVWIALEEPFKYLDQWDTTTTYKVVTVAFMVLTTAAFFIHRNIKSKFFNKQSSLEPFPLERLPEVPLIKTFELLDLPDLKNLRLVKRNFCDRASQNAIWKLIAEEINCSFKADTKVMEQVKAFVINLKEIIKNFPKNPKDIIAILKNPQPTIQNIKTLQEYRKARDTIVMWKEIAKEINEKVPELDGLNSSEKVIHKCKDFNGWCNKYQNKLAQILRLFLCNHLSSLPKEIGNLIQLQALFLLNNSISSLPVEIWNLTQLETLYFENNHLSSPPEEIWKRTQLQSLFLSGKQLSSLSKEIWNLTQLQSLFLSGKQLSSLPKGIGGLTQLKELALGEQLSSLPKGIGKLIRLDRLSLRNNHLSSLPKRIGKLTQLTFLHLTSNRLSSLPKEIGNLTQLITLELENNKLSTLPKEIRNLTRLKYLNLKNNKLSSLPKEIGKLTQLTQLILSNNQLSTLPKEIGKLTRLTLLHLTNNRLSSLPKEIGNLTQLIYLNLNNNYKLSTLPKEINKLTRLQRLLSDNPLPAKIALRFFLRDHGFETLKYSALMIGVGTLLFCNYNNLVTMTSNVGENIGSSMEHAAITIQNIANQLLFNNKIF